MEKRKEALGEGHPDTLTSMGNLASTYSKQGRWEEAEKHQVLPLDDRFRQRFAENAARFHGARTRYTFHAGVGHVPTEVAPDIRSRSYRIEAHATFNAADNGVLSTK